MHEMSMAMSIVDIAVREAGKAGAMSIDEIEIEVGLLAGVMPEALAFCLEAAARGTLAASASFRLIQIAGRGHCQTCQREVEVSEFPAQCPACDGFAVRLSAGTELRIRSISIDEEQQGETEYV